VTVADLTYQYRKPSAVRQSDTGTELLLTTSGGVTEAGPCLHPYFFSGFLTEPGIAATGMLACAAVARSRYFLPGNVVAILRDPVVTSNADRLRFEAFSSCCGVHARLDLLPGALAEPPVTSGTTNVDFNEVMRAALASAAISGPLLLSVGSDEVVADISDRSVTERRVPLPARWLKGFGEVQALARHMQPVGELTGAAAHRFVRTLPRAARRPLWAYPAAGSFALGTTARPGAACIAGPHRLYELGPLLRFARRLRVYGPAADASMTEAPSAWELDLGSARFTLTLSPANYRGFSGEGALLELLADDNAAADADLLAGSLDWRSGIDVQAVAARLDITGDRVVAALGYMAASGRVGYDLAEGTFFHRELPFGAPVEAMHPRLVSAGELVASGAVTITETGAVVRSSESEHRVTFATPADRCTCPWWGKHQGSRGPCKHVLAARLATRNEARGA
jgi:SWIM zinc finger